MILNGRTNEIMEKKGSIFDIQGFSVHDGPGCRTLIFLKGCPLRCYWCSNPEGLISTRQIMYHRNQCVKCHSCIAACEMGAIHPSSDGVIEIERNKCRQCTSFQCVDACDHNALSVSGYYMTVDELMVKIQKDRQYWGAGGGVTLSGGEPMFQFEFTREVLKRCYESYIHTGMETSGYAPWNNYKVILPYLEWLFFDLKHMDPEQHRLGTGFSNKLILDNARKIALQYDHRLIFRMPLIPKFNDSIGNVMATAEFMNSIGRNEINILPIHHLGSSKYDLINLDYGCGDLKTMAQQKKDIFKIFSDHGINCYIGSDTPF